MNLIGAWFGRSNQIHKEKPTSFSLDFSSFVYPHPREIVYPHPLGPSFSNVVGQYPVCLIGYNKLNNHFQSPIIIAKIQVIPILIFKNFILFSGFCNGYFIALEFRDNTVMSNDES